MNNNDIKIYENEIQSLEEEIKMLTEEYECSLHGSFAYSDGEIMKAMKSFKGKSQEDLRHYEFSPDLKTQLDFLESDLFFMMKFTGICFTHCSRKPVEKSGTRTTHKYRLSGNCHSVSFQLEFQLMEENQAKEEDVHIKQCNKNVSAIVTDLSIVIESDEYLDLSKLVSRVEESGNLLLFFKCLSYFTEWCDHRKRTLTHFKNKYPDVVVLPEGSSGDYMILRSANLPGLELIIVWKIYVDEGGKVTPVLDLLPKIPMSVVEANKFASDAPYCFRSLLHVLGIQACIETLIKSLCNDK
ncbi:centromere protein P [Podarcis raffonei]|uniref:centromere protein P n=1 Tax=Podarcis raffonei TaxID=65483 RepID=UPI00232956E2|nr:centromere protein P [Podarcis raffonei]XP_053233616.1 centromere protein P [Podarcis raffonei]